MYYGFLNLHGLLEKYEENEFLVLIDQKQLVEKMTLRWSTLMLFTLFAWC